MERHSKETMWWSKHNQQNVILMLLKVPVIKKDMMRDALVNLDAAFTSARKSNNCWIVKENARASGKVFGRLWVCYSSGKR